MYEKPQYLTPDGYKRSSKNPLKKGTSGQSLYQELTQKKMELAKKQGIVRSGTDKKGLSNEAAKIIALAIKGMLKNT
jgi:hypothetical protein